jgi:acyl-CoA hydrolase
MLPADAVAGRRVHAGPLMNLADSAGGGAAMRHTGCPVVTAAADWLHFSEPVYVGDIVEVRARVTWTGRTSIETNVVLTAQSPTGGAPRQVANGYFVYVALDDQHRPCVARRLAVTTAQERDDWRAAEGRHARRLASRSRSR